MKYKYKSLFKQEFNDYIEFRTNNGVTSVHYQCSLKKLDIFLQENCMSTAEKRLSKEMTDAWICQTPGESDITHYRRVNDTKHFVSYLLARGYDVHLFWDVRSPSYNFVPYIYSQEETLRYFQAVDSYAFTSERECINMLSRVMIPVLFRILYGCGTRITETLNIRKCDVNLEEGLILLRKETKNDKERIVVMEESLTELMRSFADKTFYMLKEDDYIFHNASGRAYSSDRIRDIHEKLLKQAGIPRRGKEIGPRIHDWRHTWAVNAFKKLSDAGYDLYVALPIISTYMGHKKVDATEKYLKLIKQMYPEIDAKATARFESIMKGESND